MCDAVQQRCLAAELFSQRTLEILNLLFGLGGPDKGRDPLTTCAAADYLPISGG